ncbi:MAG: hypothetical protein IBX64_11630 [Actinobacteria bacterium]|nr:hypothetical protein [Actinomycetota bacterium]
MKKSVIAFLGIMLILTMLTGGTFAYMTAQTENAGNTITTGSMRIQTEPEPFMTLKSVMPGGPAQEARTTIFTHAPTKFSYKIKAVRQVGTSTKLWNAIMVEVKDSVTSEIWTGKLNSLDTAWFARDNGVNGGGLDNGHLVGFKVWIPQEADVDAETTATIKFRFDAEQWRPISN